MIGVDIGKVPATLEGPNRSLWEAALSNADLENHHQGDNAVLPARVTDVCNITHDIEAAAITVPLGPAPGVRVSDLQLAIEYSPPEECAVPTSLTVPVAIVVTASAESHHSGIDHASDVSSYRLSSLLRRRQRTPQRRTNCSVADVLKAEQRLLIAEELADLERLMPRGPSKAAVSRGTDG